MTRAAARAGVAVAVAALVACGGGDDAGPPVEATVGDFVVRVVPAEGRVEVRTADGTPVIDTGAGGFALGRGDATIEHRFGMFAIEEGARDVRTAARFADARVEADGRVTFTLDDADGVPGMATIDAAGDGALAITIEAAADDDRASVSFGCGADEHFLGLGGQSFDVDHHGQRVPLWVSEDGISKQDTDDLPGIWALIGRRHTTHTPMPAFVSSRGFGAVLDTFGGGDRTFAETGGLAYAWHGAALHAPPTSATWNGAPVTPTVGRYVVTGPGTLELDGGAATLTITGGAATRALAIRVAP